MDKLFLLVLAACLGIAHGSNPTYRAYQYDVQGQNTVQPSSLPGTAQRLLLVAPDVQGGPASAFNRASRPHQATKERDNMPDKTIGVAPAQLDQPVVDATASATVAPRRLLGAAAVKGGPADAINRASRARHATKEASRPGKATGAAPTSRAAVDPSTQRSLLSTKAAQGGPADAFNKATRAHHATKEAPMPGKATGVPGPASPQAGLPSSSDTLDTLHIATQRKGPAEAFNKATRTHHATREASQPSKATGVVPTQPQQLSSSSSTLDSATQRNLLSAKGGPADAFNRATLARHATKEASRPGKTAGATPTKA